MKEIEETDLCILCNSPGSGFEDRKADPGLDRSSDPKHVGSVSANLSGEKEADLLPQLRVIFLVQQIFKCSLHDEGTLKVMQALGDPSGWFQICGRCCDLVDKGIEAFRKLKKCEEEYHGIRGKLEREAFQSNNESVPRNHILVRNETTENSRIRFGLRRKLRGHGVTASCKIKEEPELMSDEDHWAPINEPLSSENSESCDSVEIKKQQGYPLKQKSQLHSSYILPTTTDNIPETEVANMPRLRNRPRRDNIKNQLVRRSGRMRKDMEYSYIDDGCDDDTFPRPRKRKLRIPQERKSVVQDERLLDVTTESGPAYELPKSKQIKRKSVLKHNYDKETEMSVPRHPKTLDRKRKSRDALNTTNEDSLSSEPLPAKRIRRSRFNLKADSEEESYKAFDNSESEDPEFKFNDNLKQELGEKNNQHSKLLKRRIHDLRCKVLNPEDMKLFFEKCPEYLDMNLIVYPPETAEEKAKIPKSVKIKEKKSAEGLVKQDGFPCPSCKKSFNSKFYTIAHIHRVHLGIEKPWRCNQCSYTAIRARRFRHHITDHKDGKLKSCKICNTSFRSQNSYHSHVINHQKGVISPKCSECQQSFNRFTEYVKHMKGNHGFHYYQFTPGPNQKLVCEFCSKILTSQKLLEYHKVKCHNEEDPTNKFPKCSECNQVFFMQGKLEEHIQIHHSGESSNAYFCEFCGKGFKASKYLAYHNKMEHTEQEPQYCQLCGMQVKNSVKLRHHMLKNHREAISMSSEELEEYRKKKNEEMAFKCNLCEEAFPFRVLLYYHCRFNHPEVTNKFKCDQCGKGFSRQSSVKRHCEDSHMNLKVNCEFCGKEFSKGDSLAQHKRHYCSVKKQKDQEQGTLPEKNLEQEKGNLVGASHHEWGGGLQLPVLPNMFYEGHYKNETGIP